MAHRIVHVATALVVSLTLGCDSQNTYLDCVAQGSGASAADKPDEHKRACMKKFQQKLPQPVVESMKGESNFYENLQLVSGSVHNRSQDWLITEVTIAVYPDGRSGEKHLFRAEVDAEPLSSSDFSIKTYTGIKRSENYGWGIEEAYGIQTK